MDDIVARMRRTSKLGRIGESLAAEALQENGFQNVRNLNDDLSNHPFADLLAEKDGRRYFVGVKTRNEDRDIGNLNESYNCVLVRDQVNRLLKSRGMSSDAITILAIQRVYELANDYEAVPAWIAVPTRPKDSTYCAFFGLLSELGNRRSIPMSYAARKTYLCLVNWRYDARLIPDLTNQL